MYLTYTPILVGYNVCIENLQLIRFCCKEEILDSPTIQVLLKRLGCPNTCNADKRKIVSNTNINYCCYRHVCKRLSLLQGYLIIIMLEPSVNLSKKIHSNS